MYSGHIINCSTACTDSTYVRLTHEDIPEDSDIYNLILPRRVVYERDTCEFEYITAPGNFLGEKQTTFLLNFDATEYPECRDIKLFAFREAPAVQPTIFLNFSTN